MKVTIRFAGSEPLVSQTGSPPLSSRIPQVQRVEFLDAAGDPLPVVDGFVSLQANTIIRAMFDRPIQELYIFLTPTGTDAFRQTRLIGVVAGNSSQEAEFQWQVPPGTGGSLYVIGCEGTLCRRSQEWRVFRPDPETNP